MAVDQARLEAFMGKMAGDMGAAMSASLVVLGDRLGLYRSLVAAGPSTSAELAVVTGLNERNLREWLAAQAAAGYVDYDDASGRFALNAEQATVFADENSPAFMAGGFEVIAAMFVDEPKVAEAFRTGAGVGWHEHCACLFSGTERFFRPGYNASLVSAWILRPGLFLPPLMLSEDEVEAVLLGLRYVDQRGDEVLRSAAAVALAKIGAVLSPQAQAQIANPLAGPGPRPSFPPNTAPLDELRAAIRGQTRLDIRYEDERGQRTERIVWPIQLGFLDRARVLSAWCELREDFRTFRTDRINAMERLDRYPGRRADLARRLRAHLDALANPERS